MKKLKLNLNELKIDSFETGKIKTEKGTIKANDNQDPTIPQTHFTCEETCRTCFGSCGGSCGVSCGFTCP